MADGLSLPAAPQKTPGLPENFTLLKFDGFEGLNTKPTRPAIKDQEMFWCDNWMPVGPNNLRTLYDIGDAIYTAPTGLAVSHYDFGNISDVPVCMVFLSDGSIVQVNTNTMVTTSCAASGTITDPTQTLDMSQWGSQYILICAPQTNGYFIWDGTSFYKAGSLGPLVTISNAGLDYTSPPTITAVGGSGSGATFSSVVTNGSVTQITVTNPGSGYNATDAVTLSFSGGGSTSTAKATASISGGVVTGFTVTTGGSGYTQAGVTIVLSGGGGTGATATASVSAGAISSITVGSGGEGYSQPPTVVITDANNPVAQATVDIMPFGISGTTIETYTNRVWIANGAATTGVRNRTVFSAPSSVADFTEENGGGSFLSNDSFLRVGYHSLKQSNGFLYLIGDSSVNYISGVTTSGTPPATTFSNQNVDPQIGSPWPKSVQVYSRAIVFANSFGIHAMFGGAVQKVSTPLDGIYSTVPVSSFSRNPSSAVAIIFGIHVYMLLLPIIDPISGNRRNALLMWDGKKWFTASQSVSLTRIASQEINSVLTAYGTDDTSIYPLFQTPSISITKTAQSKFWDIPTYIMTKMPMSVFGLFQENASEVASFNVSVDSESGSQTVAVSNLFGVVWKNASGSVVTWKNNSSQTVTWAAIGLAPFRQSINKVSGALIGATVTSTAKDLTLISISIVEQQNKLNL